VLGPSLTGWPTHPLKALTRPSSGLRQKKLGSPLTRNFHLRCIELFGTKADGRFNALKLPRLFEAL
jgi:hypothetical protein